MRIEMTLLEFLDRAPSLARVPGVTEVRLADRDPVRYLTSGRARWVHVHPDNEKYIPDHSGLIPWQVHQHLRPTLGDRIYDSAGAALADLSRACLAHLRDLAAAA